MPLSKQHKSKFFRFGADVMAHVRSGFVFANVQDLLAHPRLMLRPEAGGIPPLKAKLLLTQKTSRSHPPGDFTPNLSGYMLVSERVKRVFQQVDADAFAFAECDYRRVDGSLACHSYLCTVVRELDAVDEENSQFRIEVSDDYHRGKYYAIWPGMRVAFRREVIGSAHVFMTPYSSDIFCDRNLPDAMIDAGIMTKARSNGMAFEGLE